MSGCDRFAALIAGRAPFAAEQLLGTARQREAHDQQHQHDIHQPGDVDALDELAVPLYRVCHHSAAST
jgi:hypothetical protein